jgi:hypothetical protein
MKLRHMLTFGCPVFSLQNELSSGGTIPYWSPCAQLGVNLGPSPSHARNVFLILNLHTGCVSPQFHCRFNNFFEIVKHGGPDVSIPSIWQQLAGLVTATQRPSMEFHDNSRNQFQHASQSDAVPTSTSNASAVPDDVFVDFYHKINDSESVTTAPKILQQAYDISPREDVPLPNLSLNAGISSRSRMRKMSQAMAESVSQREFFGKDKKHSMAACAVTKHDYDRAQCVITIFASTCKTD